MPWEESHSPTFSARHDSSQRAEAAAVLQSLEAFREEVAGLFEHVPADIAVVLHPRAAALALAHPWLPLARSVAAPASRRYFAGWFTERDIHVLSSPASSGAPRRSRARARPCCCLPSTSTPTS